MSPYRTAARREVAYLSPAQRLVLEWLREYEPCAWGFAPIRTLRILQERHGFVRWMPYATGVLGGRNEGAWKITAAGRAALAAGSGEGEKER